MQENPLKAWRAALTSASLENRRKYSLRSIAARTGIHASNISVLENGGQKATATTLCVLERDLGAPDGAFAALEEKGASERGRKGGQTRAARAKETNGEEEAPESRAA